MAGSAVIGALRVNLGLDTAQFSAGLKASQASLAKFGKTVAVGFAAVATAAAAAGGGAGAWHSGRPPGDRRRPAGPPDDLWRRLRPALRGGAGQPVLIVPSLINRAYILDLTSRRSFVAHLARAGYRPLLLDWGPPQGPTLSSTLAETIYGRAQAALDAAIA